MLRAREAVELAHVRVARDADHPADPLVADEVEQLGALGEVHAPGIAALLVLRARPATADRQHLERRGAGLEFALAPRLLRGAEHGLVRIVGLYDRVAVVAARSEEHTSELQSLMRLSYAVFC